MRTSQRGLAWVLIWSAFLLADLAVCGLASAQSRGGAKPTPPLDILRPICFCGQTKNYQFSLLRADTSGESIINVNPGVYSSSWPRWSPDGSMIGGYHKTVDRDTALMVMNRNATAEHEVMTAGQFNAWNLARPGVLDSEYRHASYFFGQNCWLGNDAFVFSGRTTYDASFFGGTSGTTVTYDRLFIVDLGGTITPLTETAARGITFWDSNPHWSPALDKIVFYGKQLSGVPQLYAINPNGTDLTQITRFGSVFEPNHAVWSPEGDRLAVMGGGNFTTLSLDILDVDLSQPNPGTGEGGRVTAVLPFKGSDSASLNNPSWSPDGRRIVYEHLQKTSQAGGYAVGDYIVIADVETGAETIVSGPKSNVSGPDWDPLDLLP